MELNLEKFKIRKTKPIILGNAGLPDDTERYHLEGMEMIGIDVFKDDKLILFNIEGSQNCEICFFESTGKCKSLVNIDYNSEANFIKNKINEKNYGSFLEKLKKRKFDFKNLKSLNIFTKETLSGEKIEYVIEKNGFALISAPGKYMSVDSSEVATDLYIFIKRNNKKNFKQEAVVPEPLADVKSEISVSYTHLTLPTTVIV